MKVFIDTNIMIDFLENRQPFADNAIRIFELSALGIIELYVSDLTIANVRYITQKKITLTDFYQAMASLQEYIHITTIGELAVRKAIQIQAKDFEDALQYYSAEFANADVIVTRNITDYYFATLPVLTPSVFLEQSPAYRR